jgi:hypothetical protein
MRTKFHGIANFYKANLLYAWFQIYRIKVWDLIDERILIFAEILK